MIGLVFGISSFLVHQRIEKALKAEMATTLETILKADVTALKIWLREQESTAASLAKTPTVRSHVRKLLEKYNQTETIRELAGTDEFRLFREEMQPIYETHGFDGFAVIDPQGKVLISSQDLAVGMTVDEQGIQFLRKVLTVKPHITPPILSKIPIKVDGADRAGFVPVLYVGAAVKDLKSEAIATLAFVVPPGNEFTEILQVARMGDSGETYAFNSEGVMVSESRFTEQLVRVGLLADQEGIDSVLNIDVRDPGVDMTTGNRPEKLRKEQPFTKAVELALAGKGGVDVDGYKDYRGVPVVGAWTWLDDYEFGVATEVDRSEAFKTLYLLRNSVRGMIALLLLSSVLIYFYSRSNASMQRKMQDAMHEAQELGQYQLEHKLGEGGMGVVYKGHHAMLKRPTAIKLIQSDRVSDDSLARFEREVRLTSQLSHPNTISIYDFGRTPDGIFYYAMEYLEGMTLQDLVEQYGPQPANRVIHILKQVCGSLYEAHLQGLIHRDIKPQNIMLTSRGGEFDVAKVLDFGLVKVVDSKKEATLTATNAITGTPLYLSPEAINNPQSIDGRSDLYALGAVGYFLLTGTPVFDDDSVMAICMHQTNTLPEPPSLRTDQQIPAKLEAAILACLAKKQTERPTDAFELSERLDAVELETSWTQRIAGVWWNENRIDPVNLSQIRHVPVTTAAETLIVSKSAVEHTLDGIGDEDTVIS